MKKYLILFIAAISMTTIIGCDSDDEFNPPNYATFADNSMDVPVNENSSNSFEVTVYTANVTGSDRTFSLEVDESSSLDPAAYTMPDTVTIPANSNEVTFTVEVTDNNLDNAGDTLILNLGDEEGLYTGDALTVNISRICEFDPAGNYINDSGWFEAEVPAVIEAGASANQYVVRDLFAEGTDITFTVNDDYTITIPTQDAWVHADYGQASVTGQAGSRVEACNGKLTLVLEHTVEAGSFGTYSEVFTMGDLVEEEPGDGDTEEDTEEDTEDDTDSDEDE